MYKISPQKVAKQRSITAPTVSGETSDLHLRTARWPDPDCPRKIQRKKNPEKKILGRNSGLPEFSGVPKRVVLADVPCTEISLLFGSFTFWQFGAVTLSGGEGGPDQVFSLRLAVCLEDQLWLGVVTATIAFTSSSLWYFGLFGLKKIALLVSRKSA